MSLAFVFPGQGSQALGMLQPLAGHSPVVRQTFAEASQVLGFDLWALAQQGSEADLNRTENTQPLMLTAGIAVWRVWQAAPGRMPGLLAGHSLGEYTALVAGGALEFTDAVKLVAARGRAMQQAVPAGTGAMAAVMGMELDPLAGLCAQASEQNLQVVCANLNAPGQIVIAGHKAAVERVCELAKAASAKRALLLPVSVPSHSPLMQPAAQMLQHPLAGVPMSTPQIPVLHNSDVQTHADAAAIRAALLQQLTQPVRWIETVQAMRARGITTVIECGPGKVLVGLVKRIDKELNCLPVYDAETLSAALTATA